MFRKIGAVCVLVTALLVTACDKLHNARAIVADLHGDAGREVFDRFTAGRKGTLQYYDAIAKAGSMLGSGAVIVMDDTRCMVKSLQRLSYFYSHESCGQCTPCREGTGWLWRMVDRIENGQGRASDLDLLNSVADNIQGRTICALGDAAAMPVRGMIKHFRHEFEYPVEHKTCMVPAYV